MEKITPILKKTILHLNGKILVTVFLLTGICVNSQELTEEFVTAGYTLTDLGSVDQLPSQYGGLTIRPEQPNTLYICGNANDAPGKVYTVPLLRDPVTHHITGFADSASYYADAPDNDGGLFFAPNGTLLFTRYSMNHLGQILPDNTYVTVLLDPYGINGSVGSFAFVPSGYPGAGNLIIVSYNASIFYNVPFTVDGSGQYILSNQTDEVSVSGLANGPEGIAYVPPGSAGFPNLSVAVSSYGDGTVMVFEVGEEGLPDPSTAREMVTGLTGAEGALIDPVTGDFLFSTFGGGDKVIRISGFVAPSAVGDIHGLNNYEFDLYPNPTKGNLKIEITEQGSVGSVGIFSVLGEQILSRDLPGNGTYEFDLTNMPAGIYFIRVNYGESYGCRLFCKE